MKILVAGAAGQVGCRLVTAVVGAQTTRCGARCCRTTRRWSVCRGLDIELAAGDLTDEAFVDSAVTGVDAVIHTANIVGPQFDNNMQIDRLITRVCGAHADHLERLVYTSFLRASSPTTAKRSRAPTTRLTSATRCDR